MAIASIQSAATFPDPNVKYVFRTENGGQVREGASCLQVLPGVGVEGGNEQYQGETWLGGGGDHRDACGVGGRGWEEEVWSRSEWGGGSAKTSGDGRGNG